MGCTGVTWFGPVGVAAATGAAAATVAAAALCCAGACRRATTATPEGCLSCSGGGCSSSCHPWDAGKGLSWHTAVFRKRQPAAVASSSQQWAIPEGLWSPPVVCSSWPCQDRPVEVCLQVGSKTRRTAPGREGPGIAAAAAAAAPPAPAAATKQEQAAPGYRDGEQWHSDVHDVRNTGRGIVASLRTICAVDSFHAAFPPVVGDIAHTDSNAGALDGYKSISSSA